LHDVDLVLCRLSGGDYLSVEPDPVQEVEVEGMEDRPDNLVRSALRLIEEQGGPLMVRVALRKRIPVAAGLGGGSADAAALIRWASEHRPALRQTLQKRAGELGADIPFLVEGFAAARARGRGDLLEPLPSPRGWLVLAHPPFSVQTADVYRWYDEVGTNIPPSTPSVVDAIARGVLPSQLGNQLERAAWRAAPGLRDFRQSLERLGAPPARTVLSGTGGTYVVWFDDGEEAEHLAGRLADVTDWHAVHRLDEVAEG
jgi:4-diphosphocytidyl-2-C-methyl-D-erythritol kinase